MLDGAARVGEVVAAAVADGQPAIGITDHGNMYGVLDFYKACRDAGRQPDHRHRGLHGRREPLRAAGPAGAHRRHRRRRRRRQEALLPPDPAGRERRRLPQPHPALEPGLPRGLLLQAPDRLGAARAHSEGVIATTGCLGGDVLQSLLAGDDEGGAGQGRPPARHLRARQPLRRAAGPRPGRAAPDQPAAHRDRPQASGRRCWPPTTATTPTAKTTSPTTPCCACRRARRSTTPSASSSRATSTT